MISEEIEERIAMVKRATLTRSQASEGTLIPDDIREWLSRLGKK